jgi:hypothetical protein
VSDDDDNKDLSAQITACLDVISDCLRADFGEGHGDVSELSLSWVVSHGRYEIRRTELLSEKVIERALYYKGAGPAQDPGSEVKGSG